MTFINKAWLGFLLCRIHGFKGLDRLWQGQKRTSLKEQETLVPCGPVLGLTGLPGARDVDGRGGVTRV